MKHFSLPSSKILIISILLFISVIPFWIAYHYPPYLNDDSLITLTYAKNLAQGNGFVFNHPPPVLGTTSPIFALLVALFALVFGLANIPTIAIYFSTLCLIGIIWAIYINRKYWRLEDWQTGILGTIIVGTSFINFLGMEFYLFAFILILCLTLLFAKPVFDIEQTFENAAH